MLNILKSKKGSSTVYELLISLALLTFVMFFPIGMFSYMRTEVNVNDIANLAIQSIEKNGQLTPELISVINDNLEEKNLPTFEEGTILITNLEVTQTSSPNNIQVLTSSQANAIGSTKPYNAFVSVVDDNGATYLKKYRNAYITKNDWTTNKIVKYDIKCNNKNCSYYGQIQHISSKATYTCPHCGDITNLETSNEANVVYLTIAIPVTDKIEFLNRTMTLISFGLGDAEIFTNSNTFISKNGQYYFTKTLYGAVEKYYYREQGVE